MSHLKPLPEGAELVSSFQTYYDLCQQNLPEGSPPLDPADMVVGNRFYGDGKWQILYNDAEQDFFCSSEIDWQSRELSVLSGKLSEQKPKTLGVIEIDDACTATKALAGEEEFQGLPCRDEGGDPALLGAKDTFTVSSFSSGCRDSFQKYSLGRYGKDLSSLFRLDRTRLVNDNTGDGAFGLMYQNKKYDFFCEGAVDSLSHLLSIRSGSLAEMDIKGPDKAVDLTDVCSTTKLLLGAQELIGTCEDRTNKERTWEKVLTYGFYGTTSALAYRQIYKWGKKFVNGRWGTGIRNLPVLRFAGSGYLTGKIFDETSGIFLEENHPVRKYGTYVAGGAGMVAPEILSRTVGKRLAATSLLSRAGSYFNKLGSRAMIIGLVDMGFGFAVNDYTKSVNKRVADRYYDKYIYDLNGWDFLVVPLIYKGASILSRAVAPNINDWATTVGNSEWVEEVLSEDREACRENLDLIKEVFQSADGESPDVRRQIVRHLVDAMKTPVTVTDEELNQLNLLQQAGRKPGADEFASSDEMMKNLGGTLQVLQYGGKEKSCITWPQDQVDALYHKVAVAQMQLAARFMVGVRQDNELNNWAREVFNPDGTLKSDQEKAFWFRVRQNTPDYIQEELNAGDPAP